MEEKQKKRLPIWAVVLISIVTVIVSVSLNCFITYNMYTLALQQSGSSNATDSDGFLSAAGEQKLKKIKSLIDKYFIFDTENVDTETAMIRAYIDAYGDEYTVYYSAEEYQELLNSMGETYCGVGSTVTEYATGEVYFVWPFKNAPAYEAGIRSGDRLLEINGEEVTGQDLDIVVTKVKGEAGTTVHLKIYRESTNETLEIDVTRQSVTVATLDYELLDNNVGYIAIVSFGEKTADELKSAYINLRSEGMEGLIIDLRYNGGGYLDTAVDMLDYLLPAGTVTYLEDKQGNTEYYTSDNSAALDVPLVLLVNEYSASASEVFTGCMKDWGKAVVVGTTTFGKGIVQQIFSLGDGSYVKITIAHYYTPSGVCIQGTGITPDVEVELDTESSEDNQLNCAIDEVLKLMEK